MNQITRIISIIGLALSPLATLSAQNTVTAEVTSYTEGKEWTLAVSLENIAPYTAFQVDIAVPEGVTFSDGTLHVSDRLGSHSSTATTLADGTIRVIAYNATNDILQGNSGELFTITLQADPILTDPDAKAVLRNLRFTDANQIEDLLDALTVELKTPIATAIQSARLNHTAGQPVYDLQGRRTFSPRHGQVYIIGGRKVIY